MRKFMRVTLAFVVVLSFALAAVASEPDKAEKISGTIKSVDTTSNTVTVETADAKQMTYTIDPQTKITVSGKTGTLADLKAGQKVTVQAKGSKAVAIESAI